MKKIIYHLMAILLLLTSCSDDLGIFGSKMQKEKTLTVSMLVPKMQTLQTRSSLAGVQDPDYQEGTMFEDYLKSLNLYLFVFEDNGSPQSNYLRELAYGSDIDNIRIEEDETHPGQALVTFDVKLDGTAENAIIHLVATKDTEDKEFESQLQYVPDRSEFGIFAGAAGLYTSTNEAYWKRIELNCPINPNDEEAMARIQNALSHVKMVRNFARVTLTAGEEKEGSDEVTLNGYVPESFIVVNSVDHGYVAAYNENLGDDNQAGFVDFENEYGMRSYRELHDKEQYVPARHPASNRLNPDDNPSWVKDFDDYGDLAPKYMFERSVQTANRTFVIVKGYYAGNETDKRYFKLDLGTIDDDYRGEDGTPYGIFETFDLIRNISYDITITKVAPNAGHTSVESALASYPANNISASIETRPLLSIYDGIDRMEVNKVTYVIVDNDDGDPVPASVDMRWVYYKDYRNDNIPSSETVKWNYPGYEFKFDNGKDPDGIIASWGSGSTTTPKHSLDPAENESTQYADNWRGFTLHFNHPDDVTRQKTIRLYSPYGLTRDVTFVMHKRWKFVTNDKYPSNIEVYPGAYSYDNNTMPFESLDEMRNYVDPGYVGSQRGAQLTVMFELPNDLPEAIFPLDFKIGFDRQNVENAYTGNAVATWGDSMFEEDDIAVPRMQFIKTVNWSDYCKHRIVCARFITTTDVLYESDVVDLSKTTVRVTNPYFMMGEDDFYRTAHEDVIDPTRTNWYWNFSYPEWGTYFNTYADCASNPTGWPDISIENQESNPHNLNNLNFAGYGHGTKDDYTNVSGTFMQPKADLSGITRSENNPEFQFNLEGSSETGLTATMTIEATPNRDRVYQGATYRYDFYFRTVYVKLITKNHPEGMTLSQNCDAPTGTYTSLLTRYRLELRTLTYKFDIDAKDVVEKVLIWSEKRTGDSQRGANYSYLNGETRYYSIRFTLDPK